MPAMGIHDRDYYRKWLNERGHPFDASKHVYNPKQFRGGRSAGAGGSGWFSVLVRVVVLCLAVYGALALVRDFRTGLKPWTYLDPEKVQRLLPYLSGK